MAAYKVRHVEKAVNLAAKFFIRVGIGSDRTQLLTVIGRKTGRPHSTPVTVLTKDGLRWLVGPYGNVAWAANARAAGRVTLSRRGHRETFAVQEVDAATAAPIMKAYVAIEPITRRAFGLDPDAPLADWEKIAPNHPVFRLDPLPAAK